MKKTVFLFTVFLMSSALAIGFQTDKTTYGKQETIKISGNCEGNVPEKLVATTSGLTAFSTDVECRQDKTFEFNYETSFLDRAGDWKITLNSRNEQVEKTISINEKREAGFFLVRFLSPTEGKYQKNQKLVISVEIIDSGRQLNNAQVIAWGLKGEKLKFTNNNSGQYTLEYIIPYDSNTGDWTLEVLAQAKKDEETFGGIGKLNLKIEDAPIILAVNEPKVSSFEQGDTINFNVTATYADKTALENGKVFLIINNTQTEFEQVSLENFSLAYTIPANLSGAVEIEIKAVDDSQNTGFERQNLVVGCSLTCLIRQYGLITAAITVISIALARIFYSQLNTKGKRKKLEKEKEKINNLIKDLQKEYFIKGVMPANSYKKNISEYKSRLLQIEQELQEIIRKEKTE